MIRKKEYEKEQININEKKTALQEDLVKIAAGDAPLMILEKELNVINLQTEQNNTSLDQSIIKEKINDLIDQFKKFSEKKLFMIKII